VNKHDKRRSAQNPSGPLHRYGNAADLLWALDERAGRSLFERVMGEIARLEVKTESEKGHIEPRRVLFRRLPQRGLRMGSADLCKSSWRSSLRSDGDVRVGAS